MIKSADNDFNKANKEVFNLPEKEKIFYDDELVSNEKRFLQIISDYYIQPNGFLSKFILRARVSLNRASNDWSCAAGWLLCFRNRRCLI